MTGGHTIKVELPENDQRLGDEEYIASFCEENIKLNEEQMRQSKKFWNPGLVTSLILDEIQSNPIDKISVICKDGEEIKVSTLLLASIFPYLATIFKNVTTEHESKDMLLILPDVHKYAIVELVNIALKGQSSADPNLVKTLRFFDEIFWNFKRYDQVVKKDIGDLNMSNPLAGVTVKHLKSESQDVSEDYFENQDDFSTYPVTLNRKRYLPINDFANDSSLNVLEKRSRPSTVVASTEDLVSNSLNYFDDIHFPNFNDDENDCDPDFKVNNFVDGEGNAKNVKKELLIVDPESEEFCNAQQSLKEALQDENNLEDPLHLWFIYHDLNPRIYFIKNQKKIVKLVCPLCNKNYSNQKPKFAKHLREHKYSKFKCKCESPPIKNEHQGDNEDSTRTSEEHIKINHWGMKQCSKCKDIIDKSFYPMHLFQVHNEKDALSCSCSKVFNSIGYFTHMDLYHSDESNDSICDCKDIVFKTNFHRKHHIQVVHKKEKLGCEKCYFLCGTQAEMDEHILSCYGHNKLTKKAICDECGSSFINKQHLYQHKMRRHDPVVVQCKMCPVKASAFAIKTHVMNVHTEGFCNICGVQVKYLKTHMNENHYFKQGSFKCEHCPDKVFKAKHHLKRHVMSVHLKEKPFNCRFGCDVAYSDACNRNAHERRVHGRLYQVTRNRFSHLNNKSSYESYKSSRATEVKSANNRS
jgi:hypothetical protein